MCSFRLSSLDVRSRDAATRLGGSDSSDGATGPGSPFFPSTGPLVSFVFPERLGVADASPSGAQGVVQFSNQALRTGPKVRRLATSPFLRLIKIVRDVQCSQDGNFRRVDGGCPFGHFLHARVHQAREVMDVGAVAFGPHVVGLTENLDLCHATPLVHAMASWLLSTA